MLFRAKRFHLGPDYGQQITGINGEWTFGRKGAQNRDVKYKAKIVRY